MTITASVVTDSISKDKKRLTTFELRYPRFVHSEFMTHRVFSRNASSSRAIPIEKMIQMIKDDPAIPVRWGLNGKGMQDHGEMSPAGAKKALNLWLTARDNALKSAQKLMISEEAPHKQIVNRLLEPWAHITVVVTASSFANFFAQRLDSGADPTIQALAQAMWEAFKASKPKVLAAGMWHLPYIQDFEWAAFSEEQDSEKELDLLKVSVARCARVSYRTQAGKLSTIAEDILLYDRLVGSQPIHGSPAEHQATPDTCKIFIKDGKPVRVFDMPELAGNLGPGWIQYRQTLAGQNITTYPEYEL